MSTGEVNSKTFNLNGLRRLLNEIDKCNNEEVGGYYLESLRVTHGGARKNITYFQIIGWDLDDRKKSLEISFEKGQMKCNKCLLEYEKKFPKTVAAFKNNCIPILKEVVEQKLEIDTIFTMLGGSLEFRLMKYYNGVVELRGGYFWSELYEDEILG